MDFNKTNLFNTEMRTTQRKKPKRGFFSSSTTQNNSKMTQFTTPSLSVVTQVQPSQAYSRFKKSKETEEPSIITPNESDSDGKLQNRILSFIFRCDFVTAIILWLI